MPRKRRAVAQAVDVSAAMAAVSAFATTAASAAAQTATAAAASMETTVEPMDAVATATVTSTAAAPAAPASTATDGDNVRRSKRLRDKAETRAANPKAGEDDDFVRGAAAEKDDNDSATNSANKRKKQSVTSAETAIADGKGKGKGRGKGKAGGSATEVANAGDLFARLPDEILEKIFRYINNAILWARLERVCRRWRAFLVKNDHLWQTLVRGNDHVTPPQPTARKYNTWRACVLRRVQQGGKGAVCPRCLASSGGMLFKDELCVDCSEDVPEGYETESDDEDPTARHPHKQITKSTAVDRYMLDPYDVETIDHKEVRNPHYRSAAPMQLYRRADVRDYAYVYHGGEKKFLRKRALKEFKSNKRREPKPASAPRGVRVMRQNGLTDETEQRRLSAGLSEHRAGVVWSSPQAAEIVQRYKALSDRLREHGLEVRDDSVLSWNYIMYGTESLDRVVNTMREMHWFYEKSDYEARYEYMNERSYEDAIERAREYNEWVHREDLREQMREARLDNSREAKEETLREWAQSHPDVDAVPEADRPPPSLLDRIRRKHYTFH